MSLFDLYYPISQSVQQYSKKIIIKDKKYKINIASVLYNNDSISSIHIIGIVVHPDYRKKKVASNIVHQLQQQYNQITCNVLYDECYNQSFWLKMKFIMKEINDEQRYIGLRWNSSNNL